MTSAARELLEEVESWPKEDQDELVEVAREIKARRTGKYVMTDAERLAVREGLEQARRGEFVPDEEMEAFWKATAHESSIQAARPLFLRLGREQQRITLAAACVRRSRRLALGDVLREHGDHADAALMRGDHHPIRLILIHAELRLEHSDHKFPGRIVVVQQDDLVQARSFRLQSNFGARFARDVAHRALLPTNA